MSYDGPTATDAFAWNCRDCGFVGAWLTTDGRCPECGGRDLPTQVSRR
jgi:rubrerythrin